MKATKIARRITSDGAHVILWSDGSVLLPLGQHIPGWGQRRLKGRAGWLFLGEIELYDLEELPALAKAARWADRGEKTPGEMRAYLHRPPPLNLVWDVARTDPSGRPSLRTCVLDKFRWPGLAVWHERGRYTLCTVETSGADLTCFPTGFVFRSLSNLSAHLREINILAGPHQTAN